MIRKIFALGFAIVGLMLTLAGLGLISLTTNFLLYVGLFILSLSIILFIRS